MTRINVYARGDEAMELQYQGKSTLLGWFDNASCTDKIAEDTYWDGNNRRGVISKLQCGYEMLMRTAKGRWVRYYDASNEFSGPEYYEFVTDEQAKEWLIRNNDERSEQVLEKYFGELEEESGPNLGGRPQVGPKVEVRLDEETLAKVEARAQAEGVRRAEMLRRLIVAAL